MDRLPVGVLVYRVNTPIYANRAFLKWSGDASLEAFSAAGGLDRRVSNRMLRAYPTTTPGA